MPYEEEEDSGRVAYTSDESSDDDEPRRKWSIKRRVRPTSLPTKRLKPDWSLVNAPPTPPTEDADQFKCLYLLVEAAVSQREREMQLTPPEEKVSSIL